MPYVNVKVVGKLTKDQKQEIAKQISQTLFDVAKKPQDHTYIVFDEVPGENWAKGENLFA